MWFRNRSIQMKLVKDEETKPVRRMYWSWTPDDYIAVSTTIARNAASIVAVYVAADTLRKVVVYAISAKI